MTFESARKWLILYTLYMVGAFFLFFVLAPVVGYPLEQAEALRMLEIVSPVFLGYLGTATQFLFHPRLRTQLPSIDPDLMKIIVCGPAFIFALVSAAAVLAFGFANRRGATGMTPDTLALILSADLGILTASTNIVISNLFPAVGRVDADHH